MLDYFQSFMRDVWSSMFSDLHIQPQFVSGGVGWVPTAFFEQSNGQLNVVQLSREVRTIAEAAEALKSGSQFFCDVRSCAVVILGRETVSARELAMAAVAVPTPPPEVVVVALTAYACSTHTVACSLGFVHHSQGRSTFDGPDLIWVRRDTEQPELGPVARMMVAI